MARQLATTPTFDPIEEIIPPTDELDPAIRPLGLGETYKEKECDAASAEQLPLAEAQAELEARATDEVAARIKRVAKSAKKQLRGAEKGAVAAQDQLSRAQARLSVFVDRPSRAKTIYWGRLVGLVVGDVAACSGAMLLLGETQLNAVGQASSAAVAAVTLGAIGSDTKRQRQTRAHATKLDRGSGGTTDDEYAALFRGRSDGDAVMRTAVLLAFTGLAFIAIAIFCLRGATEGSAAAWTFGLLSAAIGIGSFINSYTTTCAFGEYLDRLAGNLHKARTWLRTCQENPVIAEHDGALSSSASTRAIWAARGQAAWWARQREKFAILNDNPRVVGNGLGADPGVVRSATLVDVPDEDAA